MGHGSTVGLGTMEPCFVLPTPGTDGGSRRTPGLPFRKHTPRVRAVFGPRCRFDFPRWWNYGFLGWNYSYLGHFSLAVGKNRCLRMFPRWWCGYVLAA